jgi:hypothetical protein
LITDYIIEILSNGSINFNDFGTVVTINPLEMYYRTEIIIDYWMTYDLLKEFIRLHPSLQEIIVEGTTIGLVFGNDVFGIDPEYISIDDPKIATLITNMLFCGTLDIKFVYIILNMMNSHALTLYCETIYPELHNYIIHEMVAEHIKLKY